MRIVSWNINSVRLRLETLKRIAGRLNADFICLQETKAQDSDFPADDISGFGYPYQLIRGMKGYNGVAILSRTPLLDAGARDWCALEDCRHVAADIGDAVELHNFYVPAGGDEPDPKTNEKFAHKLDFLKEATAWSKGLSNRGRRILVGDLNIAPHENDVWSHKQLLKVVSHTPREVEGLLTWQASHGWFDAVRAIIPEEEKLYSWWSYRNRTWPGSNRGRRLDHIWVSPLLSKNVRDAGVFKEARGWQKPSDHVPVWVDIDLGE
ncbi:MAG: Exodeoxyribonuclease III [Alphaproteobacteria bacterium MarineAlpha11_Bin1]|nr:MAG: Exodeoxyribonuclease III [Alphaproteobacteria bacterium MarineAlpha11_Bin1]|tara:strand:- start:46397 stop:47191 length:795 start_codon:yes stop_codon:yes gene_type:complete